MDQVCSNCGTPMQEGQGVALKPADKDSAPAVLCPGCHAQLEAALKAETHRPNYLGGSLAGLAAGLLTAGIWYAVVAYTHYQIGLVAILVGFIVGQAVVFGAGQKRGLSLQVTSLAIALLSLCLAEYEIVRHSAVQQGFSLPLLPPPTLMLEVDYMSLTSDPLSILFWLIAAFQAFSIPAARKLKLA